MELITIHYEICVEIEQNIFGSDLFTLSQFEDESEDFVRKTITRYPLDPEHAVQYRELPANWTLIL